MKKRETQLKGSKGKNTIKKGTSKHKGRVKHPKEEESYFVLLDNEFYVASSTSERKSYQLYESKVKTTPVMAKNTPLKTTN